jgi:hypothetical protein
MGKIANRAVRWHRFNQIYDMMGRGMYTTDIVSQLTEEWKCGPDNVYKYIAKVKESLQKEYESSSGSLISKFIYLYQMALEKKDYKAANLIAQNLGKFTKGETITQTQEINLRFGDFEGQ